MLNQTYTNFEIIVVDDGSTDNTTEVVESIEDSRVRYYKKSNQERGAARNFGTSKSNGDYINFFDSDDLAYENHLQEAVKVIEANNSPQVFHLGYDIKSSNGELLRNPTPIKNINKQLLEGNLLSCNGVFVKKEVAIANPFSEIRELSASEDYLLWLRLAGNYQFYNGEKITSVIIDHDERSVANFSSIPLIARKELMLKLALNDEYVETFYKGKLYKLKSNTYSYISLHSAIGKEKKVALKYLFKSILSNPISVFKRRFLAIIKHLLIS